jgi:enoyl-CoA hydratase
VPTHELQAATQELCARIVSNAPLTIQASKSMLRRLNTPSQLSLRPDEEEIRLCYGSEDFREGIAAFTTKRSPKWQGK